MPISEINGNEINYIAGTQPEIVIPNTFETIDMGNAFIDNTYVNEYYPTPSNPRILTSAYTTVIKAASTGNVEPINTNKIETYTITYNYTNSIGLSAVTKIRTIEIVDITPPNPPVLTSVTRNGAMIHIEGTAELNSIVEVKSNGVLLNSEQINTTNFVFDLDLVRFVKEFHLSMI